MTKVEEMDPVLELALKKDKRFCGTLCLCQMIAVLSAVSMVYLTVAIYAPSLRALDSGISEVPIICQTVQTDDIDVCEWSTCGEWCLSKSSGACKQVQVRARHNGSIIRLDNCTEIHNRYCETLDPEKQVTHNCKKDLCKELDGQFNCTEGICADYSTVLQCTFHDSDPPLKCNKKPRQCREISGLMECHKGQCSKIKKPFNCERRCIEIPTDGKNVIVLMGDHIFLAKCKRVVLLPSEEEIWNSNNNPKTLLASCLNMTNGTDDSFISDDCINGTLLEPDALGPSTNFTVLMSTHFANQENQLTITRGEVEEDAIPQESSLIIYNKTHLMINIEGCVNSLRDECVGYLKEYGKDGRKHNSPSRFPCFYSQQISEFIVTRFNRQTVVLELMIASILPVSLFVVSCFTLVSCSKSVSITEDGHYRCKYCGDAEMDTVTDSTGERAMAL